MAGPVSMMLGPFAFEALGFGHDSLNRSIKTPWADIPVAQSLNGQQWLGPTSDEVTISGVLFPAEFGGQSALDGLISAAGSGEPMMLVSGDAALGVISGYFTVQDVSEDRSFIDHRGAARRNAYMIRLKRYSGAVPAGGGILESLVSLIGRP